MLPIFFLVFLVTFSAPSCSSAKNIDYQPIINLVIKQAKEQSLYNHPYWLKLVHYKKHSQATFQSEITSNNFFLSALGKNNPEDELYATIEALFKTPDKNYNEHAQCRFIARYNWLRKELNLKKIELPEIKCNKFNEWSKNGNVQSISLIYATGYLGNPASFYGHILIKLNPETSIVNNDLLDQSINFGAIVPDDENPLMYVVKGIFGGYASSFSTSQFYRHNHIYVENEFRDLWEYELSLTKEEVDKVLYHGWELMKNEFTYFFVKENCAYRMSELLELVVDEPLISKTLPWSIPSNVFENLVSINRNGRFLVKDIKRIPSRQNKFYMKYFNLKSLQKKIIAQLVNTDLNFSANNYQDLAESQKIEVSDALIDYFEYRIIKEAKSKELSNLRYKVLIERSKFKSMSHDLNIEDNAEPPHQGPLPTMLRTSVIHNSKFGNGIELNFRPTYFDTLNVDKSRIPNSTLTMLDLKVGYMNNRLELRSFDIVNIETLNTSSTKLAGDNPLAWKIKFGFERHDLQCVNCTVAKFTGGLGKSASVGNKNVVFGMAELFGQSEFENSGNFGGVISIGIVIKPADWWKFRISYGHKVYFDSDKESVPIVNWINRFGQNREWDVRLEYIDNIAKELKLGMSFYW